MFKEGDIIKMKCNCSGAIKGNKYKLVYGYPDGNFKKFLVAWKGEGNEDVNPGCSCQENWELVETPKLKVGDKVKYNNILTGIIGCIEGDMAYMSSCINDNGSVFKYPEGGCCETHKTFMSYALDKMILVNNNKNMEFRHNQKVTCEIMGDKITDARISINKSGIPFICQNEKDGGYTEDKLGYKYSWSLNKDFTNYDVTNLKPLSKSLDDFSTLEVGDILINGSYDRRVLGILGEVIILSKDNDLEDCKSGNVESGGIYAKRDLRECKYTLYQEPDQIEEITIEELNDRLVKEGKSKVKIKE